MLRAAVERIEGTSGVQGGGSNGSVNALMGGHMATPRHSHRDVLEDGCPIKPDCHPHLEIKVGS